MAVPVPRGTLLLPTACSAELSQLLQNLSAAEEVTSSGGWKNKENSAIRGKAFLSALSLHTGGATGTSHHTKEITALSCCRPTALSWC